EYKHLSYASTLCGNCTEVCPVKINIHEMLLENRHIAEREHLNDFSENIGWQIWKRGMMSRSLMNAASGSMKEKLVNKLFKNSWGPHRDRLRFPEKTF